MLQKALILITIAGLSFTAFAKKNGRGFEKNPELRQEVEAYKKENILPMMLEWKEKIDNSLSGEELAELNKLREEAAEIKTQRDAVRSKIKEAKQNGEEIDKESLKEMKKEAKSKMKEIAEQLKPIAESNIELLKEIEEESKKYHQNWEAEIKEIVSKYRENNDFDKKDRKQRKGKKRGDREYGDRDLEREGGKHKMVKLLLWDGNPKAESDARFDKNEDNFENFRNDENMSTSSKAYPNPFTTNSNINFVLEQDEYVTVKVYNQAGVLVETLHEGNLNAGEQNLYFDANNSKSGTYIYRIESESVNETGKLILNK